ncbi:MAG: PKD domain-containing protein [Burkholderiales bacterium]|nr:PKD domain-containing protein [Burkholderiales bacterium]
MTSRLPAATALAAAALALASCGGGGSPGDVRPGNPPELAAVSGPDSFLLFPNPQKQADGTLQMDTAAYAQAYYAAIDPANAKDTLAKWKAANGFDSGSGAQHTVVFGDKRDLGYGRRMTARQNADGTLAFMVENYLVEAAAGYAYSLLNLDAAVARDTRHLIGVNGIEFSPGPGGGVAFAKFFNFNAVTGARELAVDLDGRGMKAMPGPCISCHGGRGDALMPADASGVPRFNLVQNSASGSRGDVQARLHPFEVDAFDFSSTPGFTRAEQEAALKAINRMVLCSYPLPSPSSSPEDACRRPATANEWQGTAATLLKSFYGGDGLPNAAFSDTYVPPSWQAAGQTTLYQQVIAPACRTCHLMRGTGAQSDIDFATWEKFRPYAERAKAHVFDRGNMPLAKIVYDAFWRSNGPSALANFLQAEGYAVRDASGAVPMPGRPVADPGPSRVTGQGATRLSASGSLYATAYAWTIVSGPAGASLSEANTAQPTFTATANGTWTVQLVASNGPAQSAPARIDIVVNGSLTPAPGAIRFADIKAAMQEGNTCTVCHSPTGSGARPPVYYTNDDRNGDGVAGDATDDAWFHAEVRSRINFTDLAASALLRKPSGHHHNGGQVQGFNAAAAPGDPSRAKYDLFLNWILAGAPK